MYDEKHRNYDSKSGINVFFWSNHLIGEKSPLNYGLIGKSAFLPSLVDPPCTAYFFSFNLINRQAGRFFRLLSADVFFHQATELKF